MSRAHAGLCVVRTGGVSLRQDRCDPRSSQDREQGAVTKIKVENGCYETYAKDAAGKKANAAYNAETFEMLDNAEGGEAVKPKQ